VAVNDLDQADKTLQGDQAEVNSVKAEVQAQKNLVQAQLHSVSAAGQMLNSVSAMRSYLTVNAPFDGVITERNVHPGSIVAVDSSRTEGKPMLRVQQISTLRLVVAVPEAAVSGIKVGQKILFTVPAYVGKQFYGVVARPGYALDVATRTMPVELSVDNANRLLEPGMFATVDWTIDRPYETCFVPQSSIANGTTGTYVVQVKDSVAQRVPVTQGQTMGELQEVSGDIASGDTVALHPTDELKSGMHVVAKTARLAALPRQSADATADGE
jgi:RND family efflux transporter MFP subunit